jgi:predicted transporter
MRKAQTQALTIFIIAAVIFLFGLMIGAVGLVFPPALLVGGLMLLVGVFAGLAALIPLFRAWQFNQNQR